MALKRREFTPESGNLDTYVLHLRRSNILLARMYVCRVDYTKASRLIALLVQGVHGTEQVIRLSPAYFGLGPRVPQQKTVFTRMVGTKWTVMTTKCTLSKRRHVVVNYGTGVICAQCCLALFAERLYRRLCRMVTVYLATIRGKDATQLIKCSTSRIHPLH